MSMSWCEKYRPAKLDEIYGNSFILDKLKYMLKNNLLKNMILYGPSGVGKTSSIHCLENYYKNDYDIMHLNASNERSINVVKIKIKYFLRSAGKKKMVILEEFDNMLVGSQHGIASLMDNFKRAKFILTCNNIENILDCIQNKCLLFQFKHLEKKNIEKGINKIIKHENISYDKDSIKYILKISNGDMRRAINYIQMIYYAFNKITVENIFKLTDVSLYDNCKKILKYCSEKKQQKSANILSCLINKGYSSEDIIVNLYNCSFDLNFTNYIDDISDTYKNILDGVNSSLQLHALVAKLNF